ncbi:hypothetical protein C8J56DRAFT_937856 [Mycena floridula]|nr:hypothetical protein C8J56DRAFT_937856 [Mycena floridula]
MALPASCPNCHYELSNLANVPAKIKRSARLDGLLASNDIPSTAEITNLANLASEAAQVARDLDQRIKELESILSLLGEARLEVVRLAEDCRAVMHPVRRLPQDILLEIFLEASAIKQGVWEAEVRVDHKESMRSVSSLNPRAAPWTLTHVGQRWRAIALADSRIWSSIAVSVLARTARKDQHLNLTMLTLQLQRSANHKLDIYLSSDLQRDEFELYGSGILSLLLASSTRWERLYYRVTFTDVLSLVEGCLPSLRVLYLKTSWNLRSTPTGPLFHFPMFRISPSLRNLVCGPKIALIFQMPLHQIESWTAVARYDSQANSHPGSALALLKRLTALKSCRLHIFDGPSHEPIPPGFVQLIELRRLNIMGSAGADIIISHITSPKLQELAIDGEVDVNGLISFLQRSQISLESFELSSRSADEGQVLSLLQMVPQLQNLTLRTPSCYNPTFFLALQSSPGPIPALQTLTLRGNVEWPQALVSLRESRPTLIIELEI